MSTISPVNTSLPLQGITDSTSQSSPTTATHGQSSYFNPIDTVALSSKAQALLAASSSQSAQDTSGTQAPGTGMIKHAHHSRHHHHTDADATSQTTPDTSAMQSPSPTSTVQATTSTDPSAALLSLLAQLGTTSTQ